MCLPKLGQPSAHWLVQASLTSYRRPECRFQEARIVRGGFGGSPDVGRTSFLDDMAVGVAYESCFS
jgi:hypothetical protein